MQFGLSGCGAGFEAAAGESLVELAHIAEELGFHGLWINEEHFQAPVRGRGRLCLSPIVLASALAARTKRIRIGFSVLLLPLHQPLRLAEELASLDVLSGGRVDFGVSRGGNASYSEAYGLDAVRGRERFEASLAFIQDCWSKPEVLIGQSPYAVEPKPVQRPHPPIYIGTYSEEVARWAARAGHGLIQHGIQSLSNVQRVVEAYAAEGGASSKVPIGRFVYVSETDDSARAELRPVLLDLTERLRRVGIAKRSGTLGEDELEPERFYEEMVIAGSPETCIKKIIALRNRLGIDYLNCLASFFGFLPLEHLKKSLHLLGTQVIPRVSDGENPQHDCCCGVHGDRDNDQSPRTSNAGNGKGVTSE